MILLSHPNWNDTAGAKPYRNSIDKLRTRCEDYINGRMLEPQEAYYFDGSAWWTQPGVRESGSGELGRLLERRCSSRSTDQDG